MSRQNPTLKQRGAGKELMQVLNKRDKNTRGLVKVVSANAYVFAQMKARWLELGLNPCCDGMRRKDPRYEALCEAQWILHRAEDELVAERRGISAQLLVEMDKQANGKGAA